MLAEPLLKNRDEILRIAARHGAFNVRVFGSQARGETKQDSDLDVKGPILVPLESGKIMAVLGQIDKAVDCPKIHAAGLHCILLTNLL